MKTLQNLKYEIYQGKVTITGCDKSATEIEIPSEIEGYPVKRISDWAFQDCRKLESVRIEKGLREIGHKAFYNCLSLTSLEIPNTVISIGTYAFRWCPKLKNIDFPTPNKECRVDCTSGLNFRQCVDGNWRPL